MIPKPHQTIPSPEDGSMSSAEYRVATSKRDSQRGRTVSFSLVVNLQEIPHVNSYSNTEWAHTWYNRNEFASMKRECQVTVNLIDRGLLSGDCENYCITGLEHNIQSHDNTMRKSRIEKGIDAVLEEQAEQVYIGIFDAEAISVAYVEAISHQEDAAIATEYLRRSSSATNAVKKRGKVTSSLSRMIRDRMRRRSENIQ